VRESAVHDKLIEGRPEFGPLRSLRRRVVASVIDRVAPTLGRYRLGRVLGSGTYGTVYEAEDTQLDRRVAIKLIGARASAEMARVVREARILATLSHPNIVQEFEVGMPSEASSSPYVVMELVQGHTLRRWLEASPPWRDVIELVLQAARGLAEAHRVGVIHRDFKPDNVLIGADGRARVIDFGLARSVEGFESEGRTLDPDTATDLTPVGRVLGTPAYMAPEVFTSGCSALSDQYSLCVVLYEGLFGRRPFPSLSVEELRAQVVSEEPQLPDDRRGVPKRVCAAVMRGLRRDPTQRWSDVDRLLAALEAAQHRRAVAPVVVIGGGVLATTLALFGHADREACAHGDAAWHEQRALPSISDRVDHSRADYERAWLQAEQTLCTAADGPLPAAQRRCLDQRLRDATALLEVLDELGPEQRTRAADPLRRLPSPSDCATAAPDTWTTPPDLLARGERLERELSRLRALDSTAQIASGLELSARLLDDARALGHTPMTAEITFMRGRMLMASSQLDAAAETLENAYFVSQREGFDRLAARSAAELVRLQAYYRGDLDAAHRWSAHAEAAFARAGLDSRRHAPYVEGLAGLAEREGDLESAEALLEQAIEVTVADQGEGTQLEGGLTNHLGGIYYSLGRYEECATTLTRAAAIHEKTDGARSPTRASALDNLGLCASELRRDEEALAHHREALEIREATLPADHNDLGASYGNLALVLGRLGRDDEALEYIDRAQDLFTRKLGPDDPTVGMAMKIRGELQAKRGAAHRSAAIAELEGAARILEASGPVYAKMAGEVRAQVAELRG
jgi:tetratricopeptide (TPR) repeat protein